MRRLPPTCLLAAALGLVACTATPPGDGPTTVTATSPGPSTPATTAPTAPAPTAAPTSADGPGDAVALEDVTAAWQVVGEGYAGPVQVLVAPDGRVLVVEQAGRIRTLPERDPVLDLTDRVTAGGERGLLGAAFHPDGERLFVHYSGEGGRTVVSSFPVAGQVLDPDRETVLFEHEQPAANHNGGALLFDPDGALVLALGDGGAAGDRFGNAQDTGTALGALLRFDADGARLSPADGNPFLDGGGHPALWAYGLRNPWRIAFDDTRLYVADVGQDAVEEVSVVDRDEVAGANFGWPQLEGTACYASADCDPAGTVVPVAELTHAEGACSLIGGVVVPDGHPTGLGGAYLYSDLCDTQLRALRAGDGQVATAVVAGARIPASPLGFGTGPDGRVWVGTTDGQVLELTAS